MQPRHAISNPLPLPLHFALIPSRLPGKGLVPVLYVILNHLPIYLTLTPDYQPHLSLLPLLLSLTPPIGPLSLISRLPFALTPLSNASLSLPFDDLWIPFHQARQVCLHLNIHRGVWDGTFPSRGLLADCLEHAISWDEGDKIGHNWLPDKRNIPASRYSLASLLDSPFSGISVIPDDRCIATPIDGHRRINLIRDGEFSNPSRIRGGEWASIWGNLLSVTLRYPSRPRSSPQRPASRYETGLAKLSTDIVALLPFLSGRSSKTEHLGSSFTPTRQDLRELFRSEMNAPTLRSIMSDIVTYTLSRIPQFLAPVLRIPLWGGGNDAKFRDRETRQRRARVMLGLVEVMNEVIIGKWEAEKIRDDELSMEGVLRNFEDDHRKVQERTGHGNIVGSIEVDEPGQDDANIDDLERRRGASPIPYSRKHYINSGSIRSSAVDSETEHKSKSGVDVPTSMISEKSQHAAGEMDHQADMVECRVRGMLPVADSEVTPLERAGDVEEMEGEKRVSGRRGMVLHSERTDGWNMYLSVLGMIIVSYIWGLYM